MSDLFREVDEAIRQDQLKQIWKKYGLVIAVGLVLVIGGFGGWQLWEYLKHTNREANSEALAAALNLGRDGKTEEALAELQRQAADTDEGGTAALAGLAAGRILVGEKRIDEAIRLWDGMAADSATPSPYREMAGLLSVLHQVDSGDAAALTGRLEPMTQAGQPYRVLALELTAVLAIKSGEPDRAREILTSLNGDPEAPANLQSRVEQLLSASGG